MLLLRHCHIPRLDHLARSVEPSLLSEAASIQDFQSQKTFVHLGEKYVNDQVWKQAGVSLFVCVGDSRNWLMLLQLQEMKQDFVLFKERAKRMVACITNFIWFPTLC